MRRLVLFFLAVFASDRLRECLRVPSRWRSAAFVEPSRPALRYFGRDRSALAVRVRAATRNPYDVLGLKRGANEAEVKATFRKLVKIYHPDVPGTGNAAKFQEYMKAAKLLSTPEGRKEATAKDESRRRAPGGASVGGTPWDGYDADIDDSLEDDVDGFYGKTGPADEMNLGNEAFRKDKKEQGQQDFDSWFDEVFNTEYKDTYAHGMDEILSDVADEPKARPRTQSLPDVIAEWLRRKKVRRLQRLRSKLRGRSQEKERREGVRATQQTLGRVRSTLANCLYVPINLIQPETTLMDLDFFDLTAEVAIALMTFEEEFDIELAKISKRYQIQFDLPLQVETVQQLADFIEGCL